MPKITGPTVVEHRAAQHRALLDAAEKLINDSGGEVPTLTEVAEAMGLARSSVYLYVKSRKDLIVQLLLFLQQRLIVSRQLFRGYVMLTRQ